MHQYHTNKGLMFRDFHELASPHFLTFTVPPYNQDKNSNSILKKKRNRDQCNTKSESKKDLGF